jgi:hypothetical protein
MKLFIINKSSPEFKKHLHASSGAHTIGSVLRLKLVFSKIPYPESDLNSFSNS